MTPSDAPPGMLPRPGTDAYPPSEPHSVPAYARMRWAATLSRGWHGAFTRATPPANPADTAEELPAADAPPVRPPGREA
jgi:hypothetical protein